ncbi:MAG: c-type cytochrome [Epsilonproteobacteria bacterium]|nr:c-type cytochrome [Campylobacterota bacterium]MBD3839974.1 c-type cytochrome [Campylobacterota bacterium]
MLLFFICLSCSSDEKIDQAHKDKNITTQKDTTKSTSLEENNTKTNRATFLKSDFKHGEEIYIAQCAICHGVKGENLHINETIEMKSLTHRTYDDISQKIHNYKNEENTTFEFELMKAQVAKLSTNDIKSVSYYIQELK